MNDVLGQRHARGESGRADAGDADVALRLLGDEDVVALRDARRARADELRDGVREAQARHHLERLGPHFLQPFARGLPVVLVLDVVRGRADEDVVVRRRDDEDAARLRRRDGGDDVLHLDGRVVAEDVELALARMNAEVALSDHLRDVVAVQPRGVDDPRRLDLALRREDAPHAAAAGLDAGHLAVEQELDAVLGGVLRLGDDHQELVDLRVARAVDAALDRRVQHRLHLQYLLARQELVVPDAVLPGAVEQLRHLRHLVVREDRRDAAAVDDRDVEVAAEDVDHGVRNRADLAFQRPDRHRRAGRGQSAAGLGGVAAHVVVLVADEDLGLELGKLASQRRSDRAGADDENICLVHGEISYSVMDATRSVPVPRKSF